MTRFTLKGLGARKLRGALTAVAIVLGVAMVSGTFVLTDTMQKAFSSIFSSSYEQTDAVISGRKVVEWSQTGRATVPEDVLARVRRLPEVEAAAGSIVDLSGDTDQAKIIDKQGKPITGGGNPTFGFGVDPRQPRFNPFTLVEGEWAERAGEVVIDAGTASKYEFAVGDLVRVAADGPAVSYRLVGVARFGDVESIGSATIAIFDVPTAQAIHHKRGFDSISVAATDGVSTADLISRLREVAPARTDVRTGDQQASEDGRGVDEFISIIRWFLLGFGGVSLFVGAFVIFNTLSITVAQRTRELATLRTLGASRRQVLRSVVLEGLVVGFFASVVGLATGVLLAKGMSALFAALGVDMPRVGTVFQLRTALVSLGLGTGITLLASVVPAIRATRVPAISAVREGAAAARAQPSRRTTVAAVGLVSVASAALVYATLVDDVAARVRLASMGIGAVALFVGIAMLAPQLVRPLTAVVGLPSARFGGAAGRLARQNALRNPGRTASTAAALMVGLALVTFVAVFGKGLLASDEQAVRDQVNVSHVVGAQGDGFDNLPVAVGNAAANAAGVEVASSVRSDTASVAGEEVAVSGVDPATIRRVYRFDWKHGSDRELASLGPTEAIVSDGLAEERQLTVGNPFSLRTAAGARVPVVVAAIYEPSRFDPLLGDVIVTQPRFDASFPRPGDAYTFVKASSVEGLERSLAAYPDAKVRTQAAFVENRSADLRTVLSILYALLGLSVVVSLFGMINTLVLAVFERTRELGMLRAVGMTRRQVRRMIRHEAIVTALIGAGIGIPLGVALGALAVRSLQRFDVTFSLPVGTLVAFTAVAVTAGIVAAIMPARRASRLNVLRALQYE